MSEVSEALRREFKAADDIRDAGLEIPEEVECYFNWVNHFFYVIH